MKVGETKCNPESVERHGAGTSESGGGIDALSTPSQCPRCLVLGPHYCPSPARIAAARKVAS